MLSARCIYLRPTVNEPVAVSNCRPGPFVLVAVWEKWISPMRSSSRRCAGVMGNESQSHRDLCWITLPCSQGRGGNFSQVCSASLSRRLRHTHTPFCQDKTSLAQNATSSTDSRHCITFSHDCTKLLGPQSHTFHPHHCLQWYILTRVI